MGCSGLERCKGPRVGSYVKLSPLPVNAFSASMLSVSVFQNAPGEGAHYQKGKGNTGMLMCQAIRAI